MHQDPFVDFPFVGKINPSLAKTQMITLLPRIGTFQTSQSSNEISAVGLATDFCNHSREFYLDASGRLFLLRRSVLSATRLFPTL